MMMRVWMSASSTSPTSGPPPASAAMSRNVLSGSCWRTAGIRRASSAGRTNAVSSRCAIGCWAGAIWCSAVLHQVAREPLMLPSRW